MLTVQRFGIYPFRVVRGPEMLSRRGASSIEGISLPTCISLVTATMVGTGVYTTLGFQLQDLHSGFSILFLWLLGGLISLCGALSYAEIASRIPGSGGEYTYLSQIYHPSLGFMAAFVSVMAGFSAPISLAAIAFGTYLHAVVPECPVKISAFAVVLIISGVHLRSIKASSLFQNSATIVKFFLVGVFILIGAWSALKHPACLELFTPEKESFDELVKPSSGIALLFVLYAYSGWNASTYLAGEVRKAQKTVGLSLVIGTLAVTVFYVALNAIFLTAAPANELRGVLNVGSVAANHLIGIQGGRIMSGIIALGLLASISAMFWAGPRVIQRVGEDYPVFAPLALRTTHGIPHRAILLQLLLILVLLIFGTFEAVLVFAEIPLLICLILGAVGLLVIRQTQSDSDRVIQGIARFRCPLYPLPPLFFILCSAAGLVYSFFCKPWIALAGLGMMLVPLALHGWIRGGNR